MRCCLAVLFVMMACGCAGVNRDRTAEPGQFDGFTQEEIDHLRARLPKVREGSLLQDFPGRVGIARLRTWPRHIVFPILRGGLIEVKSFEYRPPAEDPKLTRQPIVTIADPSQRPGSTGEDWDEVVAERPFLKGVDYGPRRTVQQLILNPAHTLYLVIETVDGTPQTTRFVRAVLREEKGEMIFAP